MSRFLILVLASLGLVGNGALVRDEAGGGDCSCNTSCHSVSLRAPSRAAGRFACASPQSKCDEFCRSNCDVTVSKRKAARPVGNCAATGGKGVDCPIGRAKRV